MPEPGFRTVNGRLIAVDDDPQRIESPAMPTQGRIPMQDQHGLEIINGPNRSFSPYAGGPIQWFQYGQQVNSNPMLAAPMPSTGGTPNAGASGPPGGTPNAGPGGPPVVRPGSPAGPAGNPARTSSAWRPSPLLLAAYQGGVPQSPYQQMQIPQYQPGRTMSPLIQSLLASASRGYTA